MKTVNYKLVLCLFYENVNPAIYAQMKAKYDHHPVQRSPMIVSNHNIPIKIPPPMMYGCCVHMSRGCLQYRGVSLRLSTFRVFLGGQLLNENL